MAVSSTTGWDELGCMAAQKPKAAVKGKWIAELRAALGVGLAESQSGSLLKIWKEKSDELEPDGR